MKVKRIGKWLHITTSKYKISFGFIEFSIKDRFLPKLYVGNI